MVFRKTSDEFISYFVKGLSFDNGNTTPYGFKADEAVAIYMMNEADGLSGKITTTGTNVTFYCPSIQSVKIDGEDAELIESAESWIKVLVPAGTFNVEIVGALTSAESTSAIGNSLITDFNYSTSSQNLTVLCPSLSNFKIDIYDATGKVVHSSYSDSSISTLHLNNIPLGMYMVRVSSGAKEEVRKLMVY